MARTGLYKSEVKKARDTLLAQGKHPSVDAIRIELGNTGSKSTIHKYLKELEEEDSTDGRKVSISETLQDLVARLAAQLQEEASAQTEAMRAQQAERERHHADALSRMEKAIEAAQSELSRIEVALQEEERAHAQTRDTLQHETVARHTAEQQVHDLKDRLAENESHRQSLEEKHQHARESLEHYRQSVKDQRDQDQRRHEQQIQQLQAELRTAQQTVVVKQEDVTRLNQDGARLVADLSHAKKALYDEQSRRLQLEQKLQAAQSMEHRCKSLDEHLNAKSAELRDVQKQLEETTAKTIVLSGTVHDLQVALAAANAKLEAQHEIAAQLRAYMEANANLGAGK